MLGTLRWLRRLAGFARFAGTRRRAGLADTAADAGGALCRGRLGRRQRPHHGAAHGRNPGPAGRGRERRRRRRHDRLAARLPCARPTAIHFVIGNLGSHGVNQTLYKRPLYNSMTDFAPVGLVNQGLFVLLVRKDFPASTLSEFTAYAKANQAKLQFGSGGAGSTTHMVCVLLNMALGLQHHAHSLSRHRAGVAGSGRRPPRLPVRAAADGAAADPGQQRQADRAAGPQALGRRAANSDRGRSRGSRTSRS